MFFKNLVIYSFKENSNIQDIDNDLLKNILFSPCGPMDATKSGFVSPIGNDNLLKLSVNGHSLLTVKTESKILPSSFINKKLAEKVDQQEQKLQRKLKRSEKMSLKDEVFAELLPQAFTKDLYTNIWINYLDSFIAISTSNFKHAENILALLRKELGKLDLVPLSSELPAEQIFNHWLREDKAADNFIIHNDALLVDPFDSGKIRLTREDLTTDEIKNYLDAGRNVESISLVYKGQTTFTIDTGFVFSKIGYSSEMIDQNDDFGPDEKARRIEADFLLVATELSHLVNDLMKGFE